MRAEVCFDRQTDEKSFNYGLALLRMLMCFEVVLCHCWSTDIPMYLQPFSMLRGYAVPVFMFMSFFLTQKSFMKRDKDYAFNRIWKLLLPQIVWSVVYFVIYWLVGTIIHYNLVNGISDLFWQLFTGHSPRLNPTMWFQTDLIVISVLFFIIFFFCKETVGISIIVLMSIVCLILQYSGLNYLLFGSMRYELSYPLGRLSETIPMATVGFLASRFNLLKPIKDKYIGNLIISVILTALFGILDKKVLVVSGNFSYAGIWKIGVALCLTMFAFNLNFKRINKKILRGINFITKYTLGIYCAHRLINSFLINAMSILFEISGGQFYQCVLIYIIGLSACCIVSRLPFKWIKSVV